ncbi:hypothetical protein Cgig2_025302 [Carnegiea gigantea]|uniref:Uncharacterized protein n=1 Tax=Carnegiea gigantea TaxID=171969 RepID=A0A9Q1JFG6_9CARY|nr:hypothetical protein Cgig2_025302 [Carnegiea gigantea]
MAQLEERNINGIGTEGLASLFVLGCGAVTGTMQDCLELLNNILRNNTSNQTLLRETVGFDPVISLLKLRGISYSFTQQKKKVLDHLLILAVESQWAPVVVRCAVLRSIGDLIAHHPENIVALASKVLGEEPQVEPALNSILRVILRTSSVQEFVAADCVFKNFCEKNPDGQRMLASTLIPQPESMTNAPPEEDVNMSFGSMLLHGLTISENDGDVEFCCPNYHTIFGSLILTAKTELISQAH